MNPSLYCGRLRTGKAPEDAFGVRRQSPLCGRRRRFDLLPEIPLRRKLSLNDSQSGVALALATALQDAPRGSETSGVSAAS
jgi:hypothetical protein